MKKRNQKPRLTRKVFDDPDVIKATKKTKRSKGHIAITKSGGKLYELLIRDLTMYKVPLTSEIAESGYREKDAMSTCSGRHSIREWIKHIMGKTPTQLGLRIPKPKGKDEEQTNETDNVGD
jgi:hypothetical protein